MGSELFSGRGRFLQRGDVLLKEDVVFWNFRDRLKQEKCDRLRKLDAFETASREVDSSSCEPGATGVAL